MPEGPGALAYRRTVIAVMQELGVLGVELLEAAKRDVPPRDPSDDPDPSLDLAASGRVEPVKRRGNVIVEEVGFHTPYAAYQHEGHLRHRHGGRRKYLEANLKTIAPKVAPRLAAAVRRELGG